MTDKNRNVDWYNLSMWLASVALIIAALVMIIWKTMNESVVITALLGGAIIMCNFFHYMGMENQPEMRE